MPMRGELSTARPRSRLRPTPAQAIRAKLRALISNPDLQSVTLLCLIGYLIALNLVLRMPDLLLPPSDAGLDMTHLVAP